MALSSFFSINLPYGIAKDNEGKGWMAFNREQSPIGINEDGSSNVNYLKKEANLYTEYPKLTEKLLKEIASHYSTNEEGEINKVWLYLDSTNPFAGSKKDWENYFAKLKKLSLLDRK